MSGKSKGPATYNVQSYHFHTKHAYTQKQNIPTQNKEMLYFIQREHHISTQTNIHKYKKDP